MQSKRKIAVVGVLSALSVMLVALVSVIVGSEWILRRQHDIPLDSLPSQVAVMDRAEGRRMAILIGCLEGCHGREGEGGSEGAAGIFKASAPPLSLVVPTYSDAELVRLVRFGVKRDGTTAMGMPSATFYPLGDADLRTIITHLRQLPTVPAQPQSRSITLLGRLALVLGKYRTSADAVEPSLPRWGELSRATSFDRGRYIASTICSECHGLQLQGDPFMSSPPLTVVTGYTPEQFQHLLRTGEPISRRDLGIMSIVAQRAFVHFKPNEVADLYTYLRTREVPAVGR